MISKAAFFTAWLFVALPSQAWAYSGEVFRVCGLNPDGDNFLSFRSCGSIMCREMLRLRPGQLLWTLEPFSEGRWRQVVLMDNIDDYAPIGRSGYVFDRYICLVP